MAPPIMQAVVRGSPAGWLSSTAPAELAHARTSGRLAAAGYSTWSAGLPAVSGQAHGTAVKCGLLTAAHMTAFLVPAGCRPWTGMGGAWLVERPTQDPSAQRGWLMLQTKLPCQHMRWGVKA